MKMETTLRVKGGEITYLLYNLTAQQVSEFRRDPQTLNTHFNHCLQSKSNVRIIKNAVPSTASGNRIDNPSTSSSNAHSASGFQKFSFLCGNFEKRNFIYATKFANHPWHYFDELGSILSEHGSLPASMDSLISRLDKVKSIDLNLNEEQAQNYFYNGKFIFHNKELKTHMQLVNKQIENQSCESKSSHKRLLFIPSQTNPLFFLNEFEKCRDLKTDKDKMYKIRDFVDECHKAEFTKLYFTSDWQTVRSAFLKMYALPFVQNMKKELQIDFNEESSLRSFFERKLISLSKFTTLQFPNQMEIVMNDLPVEISSLFITNEKMTSGKTEVLDFCDSIQDLVGTMRNTTENDQESNQPSNQSQESNQPPNQMEIFEPPESSESESMSLDVIRSPPAQSSRGRGRGRDHFKGVVRGGIRKRGRPSKKFKPIQEDTESSSYDFLNEMDDSSRSSW